MGITQIDDFDINYPDGDVHKVPVIDDDLRSIKDGCVNTVGAEHDNATGEHTIPVVTDAQEAVLNEQDGRLIWNSDDNVLKINISATWLSLIIPAGTKMVFDQDAAPAGWTRDTSQNDRVIRVVSGARADGGSWTVGGITADNESAHTHGIASNGSTTGATLTLAGIVKDSGILNQRTGATGPSKNYAADYTDGGSAHGHATTSDATWRPLHRDMIVATKD